jgi:hypothetical protein
MTEQITIPKETAQILFDALVQSMDFGSGFLDTEEVEALREMAVVLGVDPDLATPDEFKAGYPHAYVGETNRTIAARLVGAILMPGQPNPSGKPFNAGDIDETRMPNYAPCRVGAWGRPCKKPENDPIHQAAGAQS